LQVIRVLLGNHPIIIPDALRRLVGQQEDMEIVGDVHGPMKILQDVGRSKANAVVLALTDSQEPGLCSQLLAVYPDLTILSVTSDLRLAFVYQMCSRRRELIIASPSGCVDVLRVSVRNPCSE
jgi:DNA-binding NarL/FixJ family response regulator